jgi:hypothetical protein
MAKQNAEVVGGSNCVVELAVGTTVFLFDVPVLVPTWVWDLEES